jgi:hypothetical protein
MHLTYKISQRKFRRVNDVGAMKKGGDEKSEVI